MNDQEFREHILTFIAKSDQWMQDASKKLDVIDDLQQQVSWMRGKLEGKQESETSLWIKIGAVAGFGSAIIALIAIFLSLKGCGV